ncbi:acyl-CoA thioesterase [Pseudoponticoccus marisrubri]|uniref:Thioeseterase n=1 Tax=Pseudoponticoccus marisrubri TaxID=1685382 RepID=A0A0W7WJ28_9RHOB|nr:acyl-CoA thioesterase [Pseudoponticoccus marisrubri]KUF10529.1 thioeseterase [Pseudoponticoccus marisrubri]
MYPFIRMFHALRKARRSPPAGLFDTHVSHHYCWPWDLDPWVELNNGRTLTLYDLGRIPMAARTGLADVLRREGWGMTVAGLAIRYRRRVRMFDRLEIHSRLIGWDRRFLYVEHSMWKSNGECANQAVLRSAATGPGGIVPPERVLEAMGRAGAASPALPDWVAAWSAAEDMRPWPPERAGT